MAKVSISTVSRSFNHPDLVKPTTRKRIDKAVKKLGYIRNRAAQTIHGIRSGTIGFVVPTISHTIFAELIQVFSETVERYGFTILFAAHGYDLDREYAILRKFIEHRVDGIAIIGLDHSDFTYQLIESQNIPAISLWNYHKDYRLPSIGADNFLAGSMAAQHIVDLGHKDIGFLFPPTGDNDRALGRRQGAAKVLENAGIKIDEPWNITSNYSISEAKRLVSKMLSAGPKPSAIICGNDVLAIGAIYAAWQNDLKVPKDISIIGIGNFKGSQDMEPSLTTVQLPAHEIGEKAGNALVDLILNNQKNHAHLNCDIKLIDRETCAHV